VRVFEQILFFDKVDRGFRRDARDRIASKCGNVQFLESWSNLGRCDGQADRHAVGQTLRAGQNGPELLPTARCRTTFLPVRPQPVCTSSEIRDRRILHDFENDLEIFLGRRNEAAYSLDWLGDKSGDVSAGAGLNQTLHIVGASHLTRRISQMQRAAVNNRHSRMRNADANHAALAIGRMRS